MSTVDDDMMKDILVHFKKEKDVAEKHQRKIEEIRESRKKAEKREERRRAAGAAHPAVRTAAPAPSGRGSTTGRGSRTRSTRLRKAPETGRSRRPLRPKEVPRPAGSAGACARTNPLAPVPQSRMSPVDPWTKPAQPTPKKEEVAASLAARKGAEGEGRSDDQGKDRPAAPKQAPPKPAKAAAAPGSRGHDAAAAWTMNTRERRRKRRSKKDVRKSRSAEAEEGERKKKKKKKLRHKEIDQARSEGCDPQDLRGDGRHRGKRTGVLQETKAKGAGGRGGPSAGGGAASRKGSCASRSSSR